MTIKDLIEKRAKVWETAKNFVETHEDKNGVLSKRIPQPTTRWKRKLKI